MSKGSSSWDIARKMPPLPHSIPGEKFDWANSKAVTWLVSQPEIRKIVFEVVRGNGSIIFNPAKNTWQGVDYGDD